MRRNRFTEKKAQAIVSTKPHPNTLPSVVSITEGVMSRPRAASQSIKYFIAAKSKPPASEAEMKPIQKAWRMNGLRMKLHLAPTSFIVWMVKRRA